MSLPKTRISNEAVSLHNLDDGEDGHGDDESLRRDYQATWDKIYWVITATSGCFLAINVLQIVLIHTYTGWPLNTLAPALLVLISACVLFIIWIQWKRQTERYKVTWHDRLPKMGIILTLFVNILLLEVYVNLSAIPAAQRKTWRTTMNAHDSLPPPAMVLTQYTFFEDRAILASNNQQLSDYNQQLITNDSFNNQRGFTEFTHYGSNENSVSFKGAYHNLNIEQDLFLEYMYYCKFVDNSDYPDDVALAFSVFDPKLIASQQLYEDAIACGLIPGWLFPADGSSQLGIQQISIQDEVGAIDYPNSKCDRPEFRSYITYTSAITYNPGLVQSGNCSVEGNTAPSDPTDPPPCIGSIDIRFSTMLETIQTSEYSKNKVEIFTDEGGIIGAVMFVTWFFSIITQ